MTPEQKAKRNAYLAVWRANNRDKTRAAQQRYYEKNRESCIASSVACQKANRDYYTQKAYEWIEKNKERHLSNRKAHYSLNSAKEIARVRRRQGKIRHGEMFMSQAELAEVQGMYDFCKIFRSFEVDHIVPLNGKTVSGLHVLANLQVLPKSLNRSKGNKLPVNV